MDTSCAGSHRFADSNICRPVNGYSKGDTCSHRCANSNNYRRVNGYPKGDTYSHRFADSHANVDYATHGGVNK